MHTGIKCMYVCISVCIPQVCVYCAIRCVCVYLYVCVRLEAFGVCVCSHQVRVCVCVCMCVSWAIRCVCVCFYHHRVFSLHFHRTKCTFSKRHLSPSLRALSLSLYLLFPDVSSTLSLS